MAPFDYLFSIFPHAYLLLWKGHGEPAVPIDTITRIKDHFKATGYLNKVSFDVVVENQTLLLCKNAILVGLGTIAWVSMIEVEFLYTYSFTYLYFYSKEFWQWSEYHRRTQFFIIFVLCCSFTRLSKYNQWRQYWKQILDVSEKERLKNDYDVEKAI